MAQEIELTGKESAALDHIAGALSGLAAPAGIAALAGPADEGNVCDKYRSIKGSLQILVKILKKIPGFGPKAAAALEFLMGLADSLCPVG